MAEKTRDELQKTDDGVRLVREFRDARIKPETPRYPVVRGQCPFCGMHGARLTSHKGRINYFQCVACVDRDTGDLTRFKWVSNI